MTPIRVGDRVVIAGAHVLAGREGNVSYIGNLSDMRGARVELADDEESSPFIELAGDSWLVKIDGPVVMPARYVIVPTSHLPKALQIGEAVAMPLCSGKWAYLMGILARVTEDVCWIALPRMSCA